MSATNGKAKTGFRPVTFGKAATTPAPATTKARARAKVKTTIDPDGR
jgi:hypothetical protein